MIHKIMILKRSTAFFTLIGVLAVGYGLYHFVFASPAEVPDEFASAREAGSVVAHDIVESALAITDDMAQINAFQEEGDNAGALDVANGLLGKGEEIRKGAGMLSVELEQMALSLGEIQSEEARQAAFEFITQRLDLIDRLIQYTEHVTELVEALRTRLSGGDGGVERIVEKINGDVDAINSIEEEAGKAIARFDTLTR